MSDSRTLMCTRCMYDVEVYEVPVRFIDPDLYVCGECLTPERHREQLELARGEVRNYDPDISLIPL